MQRLVSPVKTTLTPSNFAFHIKHTGMEVSPEHGLLCRKQMDCDQSWLRQFRLASVIRPSDTGLAAYAKKQQSSHSGFHLSESLNEACSCQALLPPLPNPQTYTEKIQLDVNMRQNVTVRHKLRLIINTNLISKW